MHRRALGAEYQLFGNCLNIKRLVQKLENTVQTRWFYYQAKHPDQLQRKGFKTWLEVEGKVSVKLRHAIAARFISQQDSSAAENII